MYKTKEDEFLKKLEKYTSSDIQLRFMAYDLLERMYYGKHAEEFKCLINKYGLKYFPFEKDKH